MVVDFWGVKPVVVRIYMLQKWNAQTFLIKAQFHTEKEAKWTSKPHKIRSFSATIPHFPAETTFWSKFIHNTGVVGGFSEQNFPWKWEPQNFDVTFILLIFRYEILFAKYVDLLDKLKEVKKSLFFSTVRTDALFQTCALVKRE
jgi:hypothetical protein